jgi:hypothetical protein
LIRHTIHKELLWKSFPDLFLFGAEKNRVYNYINKRQDVSWARGRKPKREGSFAGGPLFFSMILKTKFRINTTKK